MKIISLNIWGGRAGRENLLAFFREHKDSTDIFCLQEVWSSSPDYLDGCKAGGREINHTEVMAYAPQELSVLLPEFTSYFRPHFGDHYGLCMFVRNTIDVKVEGEVFVHKHKGYIPEGDLGNHARNIQFITTEFDGSPCTIINFHGLWNGQGKGDSEDRLEQSKKIKEFIETLQGQVILCGDFNLLPDTQSIGILESAGLRNLIKETGVASTRTSYYTKPEKFADYVLLSKDVEVKVFQVLPDEVSDHAPLCVEIC